MLGLAHVRGLGPFWTLNHVELHPVALGEAAKALGLDGGVMDKHIRPALTSDEPETLRVVEPLHSTSFHVNLFLRGAPSNVRRPLLLQ